MQPNFYPFGPFVNRLVPDPQEFLVSHRTSPTIVLESCYQILHTCVLQQRIMSNRTAKVLSSVTEESKLLQLLGFFAGMIVGNLVGINSKLISRLKSISSFPAINWTTLTKIDKAAIKFDKIWVFDEVYQYLPLIFHTQPSLVIGLSLPHPYFHTFSFLLLWL